jgi:hypothetical protein
MRANKPAHGGEGGAFQDACAEHSDSKHGTFLQVTLHELADPLGTGDKLAIRVRSCSRNSFVLINNIEEHSFVLRLSK